MLLFLRWYAAKRPGMLDAAPWAGRVEEVEQYRLDRLDLARYRAVLVSTHHDQRHLQARGAQLEAYLAGGGTLVFNGHVVRPFLRGLAPFVPSKGPGVEALRVRRLAEHPVFDGVTAEDLTFRRGVAGFYGRGCNPPPPGARPLNGVGPEALPLDWELAWPGGGRLLMHAGNDLWMYEEDASSAARLGPQLFDWLTAEGG